MSDGANIEKVYRLCKRREYDRERKKRKKTKKGRFLARIVHVDFDAAETLTESPLWMSDGGAGVEAIIDACDGETPKQRKLKLARERLRYAHPEWLEVFNLIVKNGTNKRESIWEMMMNSTSGGTPQKSATGRH